jgi:hypothetical protein
MKYESADIQPYWKEGATAGHYQYSNQKDPVDGANVVSPLFCA